MAIGRRHEGVVGQRKTVGQECRGGRERGQDAEALEWRRQLHSPARRWMGGVVPDPDGIAKRTKTELCSLGIPPAADVPELGLPFREPCITLFARHKQSSAMENRLVHAFSTSADGISLASSG